MRNKYYLVKDKKDHEGFSNMVIASSIKEAKKIGAYTEATEDLENWTDLQARAVKGGDAFWFIDADDIKLNFMVGGEGFFYTDRPQQVDTKWDYFMNDLKFEGRFIVQDNE